MLDRVTVVRDGLVRLYEGNGNGLVEVATIRGDLGAEDAARLTVALSAFLRETTGTIVTTASVHETPRAVAPPRQEPRGEISSNVLAYVRNHPGCTTRDIADTFNRTIKAASNSLTYLRRKGAVRRDGYRWYLADDAPPLTVRQRAARKRTPMDKSKVASEHAAILAYLQEHDGAERITVRTTLGIDPVTFNNRVSYLADKGQLRQEIIEGTSGQRKRLWLTTASLERQ